MKLLMLWVLAVVLSVQGRIDPPEHYTNEWVIRMYGGENEVRKLASEKGYKYLAEVSSIFKMIFMRQRKKVDHAPYQRLK